MIKVYYIEDDKNIADIVKTYLEQRDCTVSLFSTLKEAKGVLEQNIPHIILLDWNMLDGEGNAFCKWLRLKWKDLPIIFLTVRNDTADVVEGFHSGADDYVTKPFELEILYSRIVALLRRRGDVTEQNMRCGSILLDKSRMIVYMLGKDVPVSQTEYQLLLLLMENKGKTVTRGRLLEQIWDSNGNFVNDNTLTVTMKRLREKLGQPSCLKTIRSFGYRMEEEI